DITHAMLTLVLGHIKAARAQAVAVVEVRGAYEIPFMTDRLLKRKDIDAVITLGCVLTGGTRHDETIAFAVSHQLLERSISHGKPVSLGVMGPGITLKQARERIAGYAWGATEAVLTQLDSIHGRTPKFSEEGH
ncbi:MAG: 6,7-dimethyl-8-ribityllumazine synthase, partial [Sulfuricaulis sp.]|nr:6,7-dimethyl-8-ribityllumazine synthase [Sulfuricaulis sp.]